MKMKSLFSAATLILLVCGQCLYSCKPRIQKSANGREDVESSPYFVFLSDIHLAANRATTMPKQDAGVDLWNNCRAKIDSMMRSPFPPAFVLYTGDMPDHYKCADPSCRLTGTLRDEHDRNIRTVLTDLKNLVVPGKIPLFYVPGNNDALTGNYYSFSDENHLTAFSLLGDGSHGFPAVNVSAENKKNAYLLDTSHASSGYFAAQIMPGLRILGLNTVIWGNTYRVGDGISQQVAGNMQMNWLTKQLADAKQKGDKVYLAMHIPPGIDAYGYVSYMNGNTKSDTTTWASLPAASPWLNQFLLLNETYRETITGIFYGHTHFDELRLLYDSTGKQFMQVAICAPGVSAEHGNNPGFKIVRFNKRTKLPVDFTTYYTEPAAVTWGYKSYNFSTIFQIPAGQSIISRLQSMSLDSIQKGVARIYTCMNGEPPYDPSGGVVVKWQR